MQQQDHSSQTRPETEEGTPAQKIAENPNPRANENIRHTSFDEKEGSDAASDVGTEITDGEGG